MQLGGWHREKPLGDLHSREERVAIRAFLCLLSLTFGVTSARCETWGTEVQINQDNNETNLIETSMVESTKAVQANASAVAQLGKAMAQYGMAVSNGETSVVNEALRDNTQNFGRLLDYEGKREDRLMQAIFKQEDMMLQAQNIRLKLQLGLMKLAAQFPGIHWLDTGRALAVRSSLFSGAPNGGAIWGSRGATATGPSGAAASQLLRAAQLLPGTAPVMPRYPVAAWPGVTTFLSRLAAGSSPGFRQRSEALSQPRAPVFVGTPHAAESPHAEMSILGTRARELGGGMVPKFGSPHTHR